MHRRMMPPRKSKDFYAVKNPKALASSHVFYEWLRELADIGITRSDIERKRLNRCAAWPSALIRYCR